MAEPRDLLHRRTLLLQLLGLGAVTLSSRVLADPLAQPVSPTRARVAAGRDALFPAVQHPGEDNAVHQAGQEEVQSDRLQDRDGGGFEQLRRLPLGSNWPSTEPGRIPRPGVVAIRRVDRAPLLAPARGRRG